MHNIGHLISLQSRHRGVPRSAGFCCLLPGTACHTQQQYQDHTKYRWFFLFQFRFLPSAADCNLFTAFLSYYIPAFFRHPAQNSNIFKEKSPFLPFVLFSLGASLETRLPTFLQAGIAISNNYRYNLLKILPKTTKDIRKNRKTNPYHFPGLFWLPFKKSFMSLKAIYACMAAAAVCPSFKPHTLCPRARKILSQRKSSRPVGLYATRLSTYRKDERRNRYEICLSHLRVCL